VLRAINATQYILRNKIYCVTILGVASDSDRGDERRGIERELKRGSLELVVLHLLAPGEAYGYEIVSKLTAETNGALEVTDGTLYPVLYRLERARLVTVRWETPERGVPRKYYRLTDAGREELTRLTREWTTFAEAMTKLLGTNREAR
jgi:PadR family transcriptional regulator PadR